ncbi:MAG: DUF2339 domain-containing protein [Mycobacterium sp.]
MSQPHQAAFARLSDEFTALSHQLARVAGQLTEMESVLAVPAPALASAPAPTPMQYRPPYPYPYPVPPQYPPQAYPSPPYPVAPQVAAPGPVAPPVVAPRPVAPPTSPATPPVSGKEPRQSWIGKVLAVAGVAVTLIGVVMLLVLAAQAGLLAPPVRVAAGAVLAGALVAVAVVFNRRLGGRIGAISLAATGIAAAYMDVIAMTTIYEWMPPAAGLLLAAVIGGGGLGLARRWDSQQLGLLVLIPLAVLAPIVTDGVSVLLVGFMLVLSAASLPVQLGKDWPLLHAARTVAVTFSLLLTLLVSGVVSQESPGLLGGASGVAALLAVAGALVLLPTSSHPVAIAVTTAVGVLPALSAAIAVERVLAVLLAAAVAIVLLAIVLLGSRLPGVTKSVTAIWSVLSAVAAVVAVTVAFDGHIEAPVFLALALVVTVAGRHSAIARWTAMGFTAIGGLVFLAYSPPQYLVEAVSTAAPEAVSVLAASALLIACAVAICWSWMGSVDDQVARVLWSGALVVSVYAVTTFTVTAGVLVGGEGGGFLAGHMAATICWIAMAAALFAYALRVGDRDARTAPIAGGLALTVAATAKLMLFDLGTLDGIFRVVVFIVVGLVLLAMGAGYARSLAEQDQQRDASPTVTD